MKIPYHIFWFLILCSVRSPCKRKHKTPPTQEDELQLPLGLRWLDTEYEEVCWENQQENQGKTLEKERLIKPKQRNK